MVKHINNISQKQNQKSMLDLQYCAKHCYDRASVFNSVSWFLCLFVVIVLPFFNNALGDVGILIKIGINILALVVDYLANRSINLGAAFKMRFDYSLFQFSELKDYNGHTTEKLKEEAAWIISNHKKSYNRLITHTGTEKPRGVKNWYDDIPEDISHEEAVKKCQAQNNFFSKKTANYSRWMFIIIIVIGAICFVAINCKNTLWNASISFLLGFALIKKIGFEAHYFVKAYYTFSFFDWIKGESVESLELSQKIIDEGRKRNLFATRLIYSLFSAVLHSATKEKDSAE